MDKPSPARPTEAHTVPTADACPNRYVTNDQGVPMLCNYTPAHTRRGIYATACLSANPLKYIAACDDCQNDHRRATRLKEITAGARPAPDSAARRVRAWADAMANRLSYDMGVHQGRAMSVGIADVRALADHMATTAQRGELHATVTAFLTHADQEPRILAPGHGIRPPLFTYDVLVLLDQQQESTDGEDDGSRCPNGSRPPECTEIDPCEACAQDADAEAESIEASMGLHAATTTDGERPDPMDVYEVTVLRTEMISYTLRATSAQDAENRYLTDGEETGSKTVDLSVNAIQRQSPTAP
ncbi:MULTISPECIES: hypothetical protein [unclassified Streptomyces]|uniref:hypothetical protein n=1 Tax=unclassified Streptomyces TaxID=2593676 RepID=UPI00131B8D05|nr:MULTISPECIES: hypothetical protein [unclassified Streptomyces]